MCKSRTSHNFESDKASPLKKGARNKIFPGTTFRHEARAQPLKDKRAVDKQGQLPHTGVWVWADFIILLIYTCSFANPILKHTQPAENVQICQLRSMPKQVVMTQSILKESHEKEWRRSKQLSSLIANQNPGSMSE